MCEYCGDSPFSPSGEIGKVSGSVLRLARFPGSMEICIGCRAILGGRPGSGPPPLRTRSILCTLDGVEMLDSDGMNRAVRSPPDGRFVVSWASSRKKHHILSAQISTADRQYWGSDDGVIMVEPRHRELLCAIESLVSVHGARAVESGVYRPDLTCINPREWFELESLVSKYRGQRIFSLFCALSKRTCVK